MSASLGDLETQLEQLIETTRQLGIIVSDFQPQGQPVLNQKMYVLILSFDQRLTTGKFLSLSMSRWPQLGTMDAINNDRKSCSNDLVTSLQDIDRTKDRIIKSNQDVMVPPEVFE